MKTSNHTTARAASRAARKTAARTTAATAGGLLLAATALALGPAGAAQAAPRAATHTAGTAATDHHATQASGPVFVQTDDPAGNSVVAYHRSWDGSLTQVGSYATGGLGGVLDGSAVDHLASQGSLAYDNHLLYAVNAGSDTITVFAVHGDRLVRRQVLPSGGSFPVSIAVHGGLVYALNARDGGSVQGFVRVGAGLRRISTWHRALGLDTTQTPEFVHTPGQVSFTPDGHQLLVTTKAGGQSIDVFSIGRYGMPSAAPVVNSLPDAVPFAMTFGASGHLVVAEAGPSAVATFSIRHDGTLRALDSVATGQAATCWVAGSAKHVWASNAGSANLSAFGVGRGGALSPLGTTTTDAGTVDASLARDGRNLYVQTGAAGVVDEFWVHGDGSLTSVGSVTVPGGVGGEGIVAL